MSGCGKPADEPAGLATDIRRWARELGFDAVGIGGIELAEDEARLLEWLERGWHGDMRWMQRHGTNRSRPDALVPGTSSVISVRMNYLPATAGDAWAVLNDSSLGYVSRYALGRDYHKLIRRRLQRLVERIRERAGEVACRVFTDSAPVLEKPLARNAGLGWQGKHTNLLSRDAGSWFFLGEIYTSLALPHDDPGVDHCGRCTACIDVCPTRAIVAPYVLDARRCISYLTIEHEGAIPEPLRPLLGNRIYGCDDCQLVCPWNRFARTTTERDFEPRHALDASSLTTLFAWSEAQFEERLRGSAIRRIGHRRWLRNIAVALGNAPTSEAVVKALRERLRHDSALVREHVEWALRQHGETPAC